MRAGNRHGKAATALGGKRGVSLVLIHFQAVISPRSITAKTDTPMNAGRGLVFDDIKKETHNA